MKTLFTADAVSKGGRSGAIETPDRLLNVTNDQFNTMSKKRILTLDQAKAIGEQLGIRWDKFDVEQFRAGVGVELEHGTVDPRTNVTDDDPLVTGKIALAHLTEFPDYYTRLAKMEEKAKSFWNSKKPKQAISGSGKRSGNRTSVRD
jgi:hypothetical protein